jgi:hypothetical protein
MSFLPDFMTSWWFLLSMCCALVVVIGLGVTLAVVALVRISRHPPERSDKRKRPPAE